MGNAQSKCLVEIMRNTYSYTSEIANLCVNNIMFIESTNDTILYLVSMRYIRMQLVQRFELDAPLTAAVRSKDLC